MTIKKELILFGVSGVLGYIIDVSITTLFNPLLGEYAARIPAFIAAATATWLFNRSLTFIGTSRRHTSILKEYFHYLSLMLVGLSVNYIVYAISITILKNHAYSILICVALGSVGGMTVNYINSKKYPIPLVASAKD